jgi:hypothetical protein
VVHQLRADHGSGLRPRAATTEAVEWFFKVVLSVVSCAISPAPTPWDQVMVRSLHRRHFKPIVTLPVSHTGALLDRRPIDRQG